MYGQTEASPRISYYVLNKSKLDYNCIGKPVKHGKMWINKKKENKYGEIFYSGPNVFLGYAKSHKDLQTFNKKKNILKTGDIGFKDIDGNFYITGRSKRIVKIKGLRISLDHLEEKLKSKKVDIKCQFNNNKIIIHIKKNDKKFFLVNYLINDLNLNKKNFIIRKVSKFINKRK